MTARVENVFDARALLVGWVLPFQELAESEHGVERRAQFMAHSREKFVLCTIRPVGFLLRQAQSILHFGARGNVVRHTEKRPISFRPIGRPHHSDDAAVFSGTFGTTCGRARQQQPKRKAKGRTSFRGHT